MQALHARVACNMAHIVASYLWLPACMQGGSSPQPPAGRQQSTAACMRRVDWSQGAPHGMHAAARLARRCMEADGAYGTHHVSIHLFQSEISAV